MVLYKCPRCHFENKIKTKMRNHFLRKKPCKPIFSDISVQECLDNILKKHPENPEKFTENSLNIPKNIPKPEKIRENIPKLKKYPKIAIKNYVCTFCEKTFTRKDNLRVHIQNYCKTISDETTSIHNEDIIANLKNQLIMERVNRERDKEIINDLRKQIGTLIDKVGDTYNNNTYNIVINPFGKENTSYITKNYITKIIDEGPYDSIPKLLEYIHFNPKHKENHNIKITNKKQPYAQVFDGNKWLLKDKKQTIDEMSDKAYTLLNAHYIGSNDHMNKFKNDYDGKSGELNRRIQKDVELTILNFQKIKKN